MMASSSDPSPTPPSVSDNDTIQPEITQQHSNDVALRKQLFKAAMSRKWKVVVGLYESNKSVRNEKITRARDTVLHVAVSGAPQNIVLKLLKIVEETMSKDEWKNILGSQNNGGDTPLHLAAALGLENVCWKMTEMNPELVITARNNFRETPLFTAVRHGKKDAFFVLEIAIHKLQELTNYADLSRRDATHCRRHDGNNILHYAMKGEKFDLAYEIIHLYPQLVNFVNFDGETALHVLANKPSVFKSGTRFGLYDTIIYYCTIIEPLKLKFNDFKEKGHYSELEILKDETEVVPRTYKTCLDLFFFINDLIKGTSKIVQSSLRNGICKACTDEENPHQEGVQKGDANKGKEDEKQKGDANKGKEDEQHKRLFPQNYDVVVFFFKLVIKLLLVVLGIGLRRVQSIEKKKQKHRHACTIMDELVEGSELWAYDDTIGGMNPAGSSDLPPLPNEEGILMQPWNEDTSGGMRPAGDESKVSQSPPLPNDAASEGQQSSQSKGKMMIAARGEGREMLKKVLENFSLEAKNIDRKEVILLGMDEKESSNGPDTASPVLIAAKRGITEVVKKIVDQYPVALWEQDKDEKNIVLLAVEHRQASVYKHMLNVETMKANIFGKVDKEGNSALHLAAMLSHSRPWSIPGAALQMQWERKWYKYVLNSMDEETFATFNTEGKRAQEVFTESHEELVKDGSTWLTNTSQSCSVVAALVATVAFASASTVPGGVNPDNGFPILGKRAAFQMFAIGSLVALCFSVTSLVMFLAILTSRYEERDFERRLPVRLIVGLTTLFLSIASMLVSFCAGDFFIVEKNLKLAAYPIYAVMCFPVTFFAMAQFKLYVDVIKATIKKIPEHTEKMEAY